MPLKTETDEEYHNGPGVSRSTLWTLYSKTPFHARFGKRKRTHAFDIGHAAHIAILEPDRLEQSVMKGPEDRRGNKWKEAGEYAEAHGKILLTSGDYDTALLIRDLADTVPELKIMRQGEKFIETSAYHEDVKCRPDIYNKTHRLMADIKNMADISEEAFSRDVGKFGYHLQHAMYSEVWERGTGMEVDAFFFICFEKSDPPMVAVYELDEDAIMEGAAVYGAALARYRACMKADSWPGYPSGVRKIGLRKWDLRETKHDES